MVVGDAGRLIDTKNISLLSYVIHKTLTNNILHKSLSQKGIERAKIFSWKRTAEETLEVYKSL